MRDARDHCITLWPHISIDTVIRAQNIKREYLMIIFVYSG